MPTQDIKLIAARVRIVHMTSAHPRNDIRIFTKQCRSTAKAGYEVTLVVADGLGDDVRDGVRIVDAGRTCGRLARILRAPWAVLARALEIDAALYQLHDPELIPIGLCLKRMGKRVVFDSHEDVPVQLLAKPYLWPVLRRPVSRAYALLERHAVRRLDGIIAATPFIGAKFSSFNACTVNVNNYPILEEFDNEADWELKGANVCYLGDISAMRGARELVGACALMRTPTRLKLAGRSDDTALDIVLRTLPGWPRVDALGVLNRAGVRKVLARSFAGLVTLHPVSNYLDALPIKLFEYMAAGIPVIASDFPLWRSIIEGNQCGICIDPLDEAAIAAAVDMLFDDPQRARTMGQNGRRAVEHHYNWDKESETLLAFYARVLGSRPSDAPASATLTAWLRARWRLARVLIALPRARLRFRSSINPKDIRGTFHNFTKAHPRYKIIGHKTVGVALLQLRHFTSVQDYLAQIQGRNNGAHHARRARARDYLVREIERNDYVDQIHAINTSLDTRQGRPMDDCYRYKQEVFESMPNFKYYGVLDGSGRLVAYCNIGYYGDFAAISQLIGYRNNHGVMHLLVVNVVESMIVQGGLEYLMFDTFFGASAGLQNFKTILGFKPYRVSYSIDE